MLIDHIAIWTKDIEKVKDFYLRYFDCGVNEKYENKSAGFSSYFIKFKEGARIELMKKDSISEVNNTETFGYAHIAINVGSKDKVDSLTRKLEKDGYKIADYPRVTGDGYYESVILDPENNKIEITSDL